VRRAVTKRRAQSAAAATPAPFTDRDRLTLELQLVSEQLIAALLRRLPVLKAERDSYRELALAAIHELHALTTKHERLINTNRNLREEFRQLRHGGAVAAFADWPDDGAAA
jgi:hypothetical protein